MTSLRTTALGVTALVLVACTTMPPAPKGDQAKVYYAQDFTCNRSEATTVELAALERAPQVLEGRCVRVTAYARGNLLYADANEAASARPDSLHTGIGLDWNDPVTARHLQLGPSYVTINRPGPALQPQARHRGAGGLTTP